jgi:TolB-like protein/tetratricopeptide (TPR) repeat protein
VKDAGAGEGDELSGKLIAVLPFKLAGPDGGDPYFALGLADALITRLTNLKHIIVRPTSAVRKYASPDQDPVAAGRELRVSSVLDGTVRRSGDRVRVTVQLVDTKTETPIWADKFDAMFTDIFAVEDSISEQVARALTLELTADEKKLLTKRYTDNTVAYELYLKGRYYWTKRTSDGLKKGIAYFQQAIDTDPGYALAYTGLADCYSQLNWVGLLSPGEAFPKSKAAATKALELDPLLAEAHTSLAWARMLYDWEWMDSEREFKRAIEIASNYAIAHLWYSVLLIARGRFDESLAEIERARHVDPLSPLINTISEWPMYFMRRYGEAAARYQKTLDIEPNYFPALLLVGSAYAQMGEFSKAIAGFQQLKAVDDTPWVLAKLAHAYAVAGQVSEARQAIAELKRISERRYVSPYDIAEIYAGLGEIERALEWLEKAYEERSSWLIFLGVEPKLDALRSDARFADLLARVGLA